MQIVLTGKETQQIILAHLRQVYGNSILEVDFTTSQITFANSPREVVNNINELFLTVSRS